ncbi:three-Cys-motif partner protein TcmP [Agrobacterium tumefaciens]|nr:three-Cys-motif partner protein TcmP [Agrobacterium tumefaciens]
MKSLNDHEFGGQHTEIKLEIVEKYLKAYSIALRHKFNSLWYIDAFAGTGSRTVRIEAKDGDLFDEPVPERVESRRGSAKIALDIDEVRPPDLHGTKARALHGSGDAQVVAS